MCTTKINTNTDVSFYFLTPSPINFGFVMFILYVFYNSSNYCTTSHLHLKLSFYTSLNKALVLLFTSKGTHPFNFYDNMSRVYVHAWVSMCGCIAYLHCVVVYVWIYCNVHNHKYTCVVRTYVCAYASAYMYMTVPTLTFNSLWFENCRKTFWPLQNVHITSIQIIHMHTYDSEQVWYF